MVIARALLALGLTCLLLDTPQPILGAARPAKAVTGKPVRPASGGRDGAVAERWLKTLNLHDEIAQLIIMPCYGEPINVRSKQFRRYQKLIRETHVGGMIVLGHVQYGSVRNAEPYAMAELSNRFQKMSSLPLLIAADFERGASMRVNFTTQWPYNMAFAAAQDVAASRYEGLATAREARALGVNWLFAPDADVNNNPDNPIINVRSYSENPEVVAAHVKAYVEGAHSDPAHPVLVTAKHFPGHGDTAQDSHIGLATLSASKERIEAVELAPFRAAVEAGVDAVMTAHMAVPALEPQTIPATVSHNILTGILRDELKFRGLVVTDAMDMQGLSQLFDTREAAVRAIEAGADVLLMPLDAEAAIRSVAEAVRTGRLTKRRIDESALKVLSAKARLGLNRSRTTNPETIADVVGAPADDEMAQRVADRSVTLVKNEKDLLPIRNLDNAALIVLAEGRSGGQGRHLLDEVKKRAPKMKTVLLEPAMSKADMDLAAQSVAGASCVIVAAYVTVAAYRGDVALGGEYPSLMTSLLAGQSPVVLASLGNPYLIRSFPQAAAYLATYSNTATSETALVKVLFGESGITGHLPVTIPGIAKYGDGIEVGAAHPTHEE